MFIRKAVPVTLILLLWVSRLPAQTSSAVAESAAVLPSADLPLPDSWSTNSVFIAKAEPPEVAIPAEPSPIVNTAADPKIEGGLQTKRIAGFVPNFQAVSADVILPPLSPAQKFLLATKSSFDYSSFAFAGLQASIEQATNTYPEFHTGAAGFARYYWHTFTDQAVGNYITGAILPSLTHEDPRYYTRYHGNFLHRTAYAFSRLLITRTDAGNQTLNLSEIVGVGLTTEVSGFYYPRQERASLSGNCVRWASQLFADGVTNVFEEFWPDINRKLFHER